MFQFLINIPFSVKRCLQKRHFISLMIVSVMPACSVMQQTSTNKFNAVTITDEHKTSFQEAIEAMQANEPDAAQKSLVNLIERQPNISNAHLNLGIILLTKKAYSKAESAFKKSIELNPENIFALNQLGILYREQGQFSKSKAAYEKAININSDYAFAQLNLGILYDLYLYDYPKAIEQYKIYQELTKDSDKTVSKWIIDLERRHKKSLALK